MVFIIANNQLIAKWLSTIHGLIKRWKIITLERTFHVPNNNLFLSNYTQCKNLMAAMITKIKVTYRRPCPHCDKVRAVEKKKVFQKWSKNTDTYVVPRMHCIAHSPFFNLPWLTSLPSNSFPIFSLLKSSSTAEMVMLHSLPERCVEAYAWIESQESRWCDRSQQPPRPRPTKQAQCLGCYAGPKESTTHEQREKGDALSHPV